jgi:hypothetical protein
MFGEIGDQFLEGNRRMPKNCGRRNRLNFQAGFLFPASLLPALPPSFSLHTQDCMAFLPGRPYGNLLTGRGENN